jgi:hypothetical protein
MSILDNDDNVAPLNAAPRREVEVLASPAQVILDIRKDIQNFQAGGPRNELVEALRDQFVATRHQAAVKAEPPACWRWICSKPDYLRSNPSLSSCA